MISFPVTALSPFLFQVTFLLFLVINNSLEYKSKLVANLKNIKNIYQLFSYYLIA